MSQLNYQQQFQESQKMYIKAYSSKKQQKNKPQKQQQQQKTKNPSNKKSKYFQISLFEDRVFTDDTWFNRPGIMPHVQNHRPVIKRRILRMKDQAGVSGNNIRNRSVKESRIEIVKGTYTPIVRTKISAKKEQNVANSTNKFFTIKETYVRQMSEVPDYAKNIMKPCKIEAITIGQRPLTARKASTGQRSWRQRNSERPIAMKKKQDNFLNSCGVTLGHIFYKTGFQSSNKIQPWQQTDQEFVIY